VGHIGKLSGIMVANQYKLRALYQISIMELQNG
jgi:hypothetical protein